MHILQLQTPTHWHCEGCDHVTLWRFLSPRKAIQRVRLCVPILHEYAYTYELKVGQQYNSVWNAKLSQNEKVAKEIKQKKNIINSLK